MKYFILSREKSPGFIAGRHYFCYVTQCDTFEEAKQFVNTRAGQILFDSTEFMVIKGTELDWDEVSEEFVTTQKVLTCRTLKDNS